MPQEKTYTITLPETMRNHIVNNANETMSVKVGLPIIEGIRRQAMEQDAKEAKKEELTKAADQIVKQAKGKKK